MSKVDPSEYQSIRLCVQSFGEGASLSTIRQNLDIDLTERTLHRRLTKLISDGLIAKEGRGKATKYLSVNASQVGASTKAKNNREQSPDLSFTKEALKIFNAISEPSYKRKPVTYQRDFLDSYIVNETFYLPNSIRQHLQKVGSVNETVQPAGTYAAHILDRLLIDLSYNSSRLEGNTYSPLDTKRLVENGMSGEGKDVEETQMILNHKEAIQYLVGDATSIGVDPITIKNLHALLSDNLLGDPSESGKLRDYAVNITGSTFTPLAVPQQIEECFDQILRTASKIEDPFEQSFFLLVHIPYLQPFVDVNKRVSRLAANIPFIRNNLRPLSFTDVPENDYVSGIMAVYELNKTDLLAEVFAWAYERSAQKYEAVRTSLGKPDEFRLVYRQQIKDVISVIIKEKISSDEIEDYISRAATEKIPTSDISRFQSVILSELLGLHEGNYARYRVTNQQYNEWKRTEG